MDDRVMRLRVGEPLRASESSSSASDSSVSANLRNVFLPRLERKLASAN